MKRIISYFLISIGISVTVLSLLGTCLILVGKNRDISAGAIEGKHIFGATYMTMSNPYYQVVDNVLRSEIEKKGDVLLSRDAAMSQERQNEEIEELIKGGAEVIFLTPVEWDKVSEALEKAKLAGVPVVVVDAPVEDASLVTCSIISDNYEAGVLCAKHLLRVRDSANILLLEHTTAQSGAERIRGFIDTIAGHEGFQIVGEGESDGQIENAMPVLEKLLAEEPGADTVMALNDPSAFGALAAIEGAGRMDDFFVYGVDGSPEAKSLIKNGMMTATCAQFPKLTAEKAAECAYRILAGEKVDSRIVMPVELITTENVADYDNGGWQ